LKKISKQSLLVILCIVFALLLTPIVLAAYIGLHVLHHRYIEAHQQRLGSHERTTTLQVQLSSIELKEGKTRKPRRPFNYFHLTAHNHPFYFKTRTFSPRAEAAEISQLQSLQPDDIVEIDVTELSFRADQDWLDRFIVMGQISRYLHPLTMRKQGVEIYKADAYHRNNAAAFSATLTGLILLITLPLLIYGLRKLLRHLRLAA
jgi:hypothetical protein